MPKGKQILPRGRQLTQSNCSWSRSSLLQERENSLLSLWHLAFKHLIPYPRKKELVDREVNQQGKEQGTERKQRREIPYKKE